MDCFVSILDTYFIAESVLQCTCIQQCASELSLFYRLRFFGSFKKTFHDKVRLPTCKDEIESGFKSSVKGQTHYREALLFEVSKSIANCFSKISFFMALFKKPDSLLKKLGEASGLIK